MPVYPSVPAGHAQADIMRELMRKARELLQQPPPDTFLGRRTHEPFADPPSGVLWLAKRRELQERR